MDRRLLRIHLSEQLALLAALAAVARRTRDQNPDPPFHAALDATASACKADHATLLRVMRSLSVPRSRLKELAALSGERLGRLKLNGRLTRYSPLSRLMEISGLQAGATLRRALWADLEALSPRARELDAAALAARREAAEEDQRRLEPLRIRAAEIALLG